MQCLQRRTYLFCLRWIEKMRPFFEAYTGPCRINSRFWPGFLLLMRAAMYYTSMHLGHSLNSREKTLVFITIATLCATILSLSCTFPRGVYKKWPLNLLESSFFLNLLITSVLLSDSSLNSNQIFKASVTIAMVEFVLIVVYQGKFKVKSMPAFQQ